MNPTTTETPPAEELTIADAAKRYDVNRRTLQRATERGTIPARKIANVYMVDAKAVELFGVVVRAREALAAYTGKPAE